MVNYTYSTGNDRIFTYSTTVSNITAIVPHAGHCINSCAYSASCRPLCHFLHLLCGTPSESRQRRVTSSGLLLTGYSIVLFLSFLRPLVIIIVSIRRCCSARWMRWNVPSLHFSPYQRRGRRATLIISSVIVAGISVLPRSTSPSSIERLCFEMLRVIDVTDEEMAVSKAARAHPFALRREHINFI